MTYYFNTQDQIQGDEAYNEGNYEQALVHYNKAFQILNRIATQRNFKANVHYYDALAYVLSEIITTKADAIMASIENQFDYDDIKNIWAEIPSLRKEMLRVYNQVSSYKHRQTTKEKINSVYQALANCCEAVSDALVDSLDEEEGKDSKSSERAIKLALRWLKQSIDYREIIKLPIDLNIYIGYLNLLERAYKCTQDEEFLIKINAHIQKYALLDLDILPIQELEILSYLLFIAVENNKQEQAVYYASKCRKIMAEYDEIDQDSLVVEEVNKLLEKVPCATQETVSPSQQQSKRRRRMILDDSDEEEKMEVAVTQDQSMMEIGHTVDSRKESEVTPYETKMHEPSMPSSLMDQQPLPMGFFASSSQVTQPSNFFQLTTTTFFTQPAPRVTDAAERSYQDAFVSTMKAITSQYRNPNFWANLLSLIGDFYYKSTRSLPFKNIPLIAVELYEAVLRINSEHEVASGRLREIYNRSAANKRMIDEHRQYSRVTESYPHLFGEAIFFQAIEDNIIQIETFLSTQNDKIKSVLNDLVQFVVNNIIDKNIAGTKSQMIAEQIQRQYKELTHQQESNAMILS